MSFHVHVVLDPSSSAARRAELEALAIDLANAIGTLDGRTGTLDVARSDDGFVLREGSAEARATASELAPIFTEYLEVITRLADATEDGYSRVDALDMAKRVTHDRGGRVLKRALRPLSLDLEASRRVFSLLLALTHDTSRLNGAHAALRERSVEDAGGGLV